MPMTINTHFPTRMPGVYTPPPSLTRTAINARSDATPDVPTDPM
jgi:hypothetical protein